MDNHRIWMEETVICCCGWPKREATIACFNTQSCKQIVDQTNLSLTFQILVGWHRPSTQVWQFATTDCPGGTEDGGMYAFLQGKVLSLGLLLHLLRFFLLLRLQRGLEVGRCLDHILWLFDGWQKLSLYRFCRSFPNMTGRYVLPYHGRLWWWP